MVGNESAALWEPMKTITVLLHIPQKIPSLRGTCEGPSVEIKGQLQ